MEMKLRVMGVRRFHDEIEGKKYDFTKVRLEMPVPRNAENECGTNVVEATIGKAIEYDALRTKFNFPCDCLVDLEPSSKGYDVLSIKPVVSDKVRSVA
jgi:hypothetical protein